ncbi:lipocalin family protein [Micromonospora rifamycinica]|uniref:lipocalin family protein n=1 Tax=Micromonospora rifamycinica TaxID=291594 RepID=UPI003426D1E9
MSTVSARSVRELRRRRDAPPRRDRQTGGDHPREYVVRSLARYDVQSDGTVGVRNTCQTIVGTTSAVTGRARSENPPADSVLTVSFLKLGGRWICLGGPNYVVIGLDPDYRWAVVGDPDRSTGFVLSREPALTGAQTTAAKAALTANGYDLCDFRTTRQDGGGQAGSFC